MNKFKKNEKILMVLASIGFSIALTLSIKDIPVWKLFLVKDWSSFSWNSLFAREATPMGVVWEIKKGSLQKKSIEETVYKDVILNSSFGYMDTFMTDKNTEAVLKMNDGSLIKLSPNSLVQIAFDEEMKDDRIVKKPKIKIFSGLVEAPIVLEKKQPRKITFSEQVKRVKPAIKALPKPMVKEELREVAAELPRPEVKPEVAIPLPEIKVAKPTVTPQTHLPVKVDPTSALPQPAPPKVRDLAVKSSIAGSDALVDNTLQKVELNNFFVLVDWSDVPQANRYEIQVLNAQDLSQVEKLHESEISEYKLAKNEVFHGKIYYQIIAYQNKQELMRSKIMEKDFNFNPPSLKNPETGKTVETAEVIFTWTRTNFTEGYILEVSRDAKFTNPRKIPSAKNFGSLKLSAGNYFWRVRSKSGKVLSGPSAASWFTVKLP